MIPTTTIFVWLGYRCSFSHLATLEYPKVSARASSRIRRPTEADTCRDYVLPGLKDAGWSEDQIVEQYRITDGRIVKIGQGTDAAMRFAPTMCWSTAPVSRSEWSKPSASTRRPGHGMQQAKNYAQLLDVPFAFSDQWHRIVEDDREHRH